MRGSSPRMTRKWVYRRASRLPPRLFRPAALLLRHPLAGGRRGGVTRRGPRARRFFRRRRSGGRGVARHRSPPVRWRLVAPHLWALRPVLVPGPRLEEAQVLVEHLVHVAEELDGHAVGDRKST